MALNRRKQLKEVVNTGFGNNSAQMGNRLLNRDGSPNIRKTGIPFFERFAWYHTMLQIPGWKFLVFIFASFILVNLVFALAYLFIGVGHLDGVSHEPGSSVFWQIYFFSVQTFTTVGYGHISPVGTASSAVASFQAFCGLMSFALATGLLYGRFSRPRAYLKFSSHAMVAPYKDISALMVRTVPFKNNPLTEAEVKLSLMMKVPQDGQLATRFYTLKVEIDKINSLVLSWTIVHPIDEDSPLYGLSEAEINESKAELMVFIRAFDETFSNTVVSRSSYRHDEWMYGAKFLPMFHTSENGYETILEMDKLSLYEAVPLNIPVMKVENVIEE